MELEQFIKTFESVFEGLVEDNINLEPVTKFKDLSYWDSLATLNAIAIIEESYGVLLTAADIRSNESLEDLFNTIKSKRG